MNKLNSTLLRRVPFAICSTDTKKKIESESEFEWYMYMNM